ncbi:hypothetical protein ACH9EU_08350 [Kocuria sp. M1R5S2]|uniref:hypothetical protein n=1 Tax=Kocuria rhizosphaerae TaxID=3376285 RepID=UPI0037BC049E
MIDLVLTAQDTVLTLPAALPDSSPLAPPGIGDTWNRMVGVGKWIALGIAVLGLLVVGGKMAFDARRGETTEEVSGIIKIVLAVALISGGASILSFISQGSAGSGDEQASAMVIHEDPHLSS